MYLQQIKSGIFHKSEFLELWLLESAKNISYSDIQIDHRNKIQSSSHLLRYYRVVKKKNRRWENVDLNFMTSFLSKAASNLSSITHFRRTRTTLKSRLLKSKMHRTRILDISKCTSMCEKTSILSLIFIIEKIA